MDHLRALEVFCAVIKANSFTGATRTLPISAPSITRIINELESHLGTPLLHRTTRTMTPTESGLAYYMHAKRILEELQTADDVVRGAHTTPTGTLRVTAPQLFGQHYISPIIREYLDTYSNVRAEGRFLDRAINIVDEGFDIAIRIGPLRDSNLKAIRVGAVRHVVSGCPDYFKKNGIPQNPSDLQHHKIIHFSEFGTDNSWVFDKGLSILLEPRITLSTIGACISSAKAGWGLTRALSYQVGPKLGAGGLQTVLSEYDRDEWPIHLVHAENRMQSAKVRSFLDLAVERLREDPFLN